MPEPEAQAPSSPTPPEKKGGGWGKIVLVGCLALFILGVLLAGAGYVGYRYYEDHRPATVSGTADEDEATQGGGGVVGSQVHEGTLGPGDETQQDGSWYDAWPTQLTDGMRVVFRLESDDFDTYLTVISPGGETTSDDDSGGGTNSRVELTAHESGTWSVLANSLRAGDAGSYRLTIETSR